MKPLEQQMNQALKEAHAEIKRLRHALSVIEELESKKTCSHSMVSSWSVAHGALKGMEPPKETQEIDAFIRRLEQLPPV